MMTDRVNSQASWTLTAHRLPLTALYLMSQCNAWIALRSREFFTSQFFVLLARPEKSGWRGLHFGGV